MQLNIDQVPFSDLENITLEHPDIHTRRWALYRLLHEENADAYKRGFAEAQEIYSGES